MKNSKINLLITFIIAALPLFIYANEQLPLFIYSNWWQEVSGIQELKKEELSLNLKNERWHLLKVDDANICALTKDGLLLQAINIKEFPLDKALESINTKIQKNISNHKLSKLIVENLKTTNKMKSFKLLKNSYEKIDSKSGIHVIYQIKDEYDNIIKVNSSFFIYNNELYSISYTAPNQYYYNRDLKEYNRIKKSIKLAI